LKTNIATGLPSFVNQVRLAWIENAARGLDVDKDERAAITKYRHREATKWNQPDGTAVLQPGHPDYDNAPQINEAQRAAAAAMIEQMRAETETLTISPSSLAADAYIADMTKRLDGIFSSVPPGEFNIVTEEVLNKLFTLSPVNNAAEVEKLIKATYGDELLEPEMNGDPLPPSNRAPTSTEPTESTNGELNHKQRLIYEECKTYLQAVSVAKSSGTPWPKPLRLLVHSGPGTGKSFVSRKIYEAGVQLGLDVGCCCYMGHPATNMPKGRTIHNYLGLKVFTKDEYLYRWDLPPTTQSLGETLSHFNREKIAMLIIDEVSMVTPHLMAIIDQKLRMLMGNFTEPFGNIGILLMGDFFQIPPVKTKITLYSAALNHKLVENHSDTIIHGAWLFTMFKLVELDEQMRASNDELHMAMLNRMRNPPPGQQPINEYDLSRHKYFSLEDLIADPSWATAPLITLSNRERVHFNALRSKFFAKSAGQLRFVWNVPLNKCSSALTDEQTSLLYQEHIPLKDFFVAGAPGYLLSNINPSLGLANGTPVVYYGLILNDNEDDQCIMQQAYGAAQTTDIHLVYQPKYICVEVPSADTSKFAQMTLVPNKVVIPIPTATSDKIWKLTLNEHSVIETETLRHNVDLKFAITSHKVKNRIYS
jgi:hypothetical protein